MLSTEKQPPCAFILKCQREKGVELFMKPANVQVERRDEALVAQQMPIVLIPSGGRRSIGQNHPTCQWSEATRILPQDTHWGT